MNHGTSCTLWNSIYFEPCSVSTDCFLVCSAAHIQAATRDSPDTIIMGPCISYGRWNDPGSRLCRGSRTHGIPGDDRVWRFGHRVPGTAGIDRTTQPLLRCDCVSLAMYDRRESRHIECHHSICALQRVHLCTRFELGDRHHLCASLAGEQPSDFHAIVRSE